MNLLDQVGAGVQHSAMSDMSILRQVFQLLNWNEERLQITKKKFIQALGSVWVLVFHELENIGNTLGSPICIKMCLIFLI